MSLFGRLLAILLPSVALLGDQEGVVDRALAHARRVGRPVSRRLFCSAGEIMYQWLDIYLQVQVESNRNLGYIWIMMKYFPGFYSYTGGASVWEEAEARSNFFV